MYFFTTICCGFFIHYLITVICFGLSIHFGFSIHYFMQLKTKFLGRHYSICLWRVPRCSTHFFFSTQPQCCLTFFWIELQMLLRCWLIHITIINETLSVFTIFLFISRPTIPHINSETNPPPPDHCCLQVSETVSWHKLRCCYSTNMLQHWVGGRGMIISAKWTIPEFP